jgi:glycosyltransferase involved in cell wall biosynthesis
MPEAVSRKKALTVRKAPNELASNEQSIIHSATPDLTVIVLTLNEEKHIARCIGSTLGLARRVIVIDSGSTDQTCEIAAALGAEIYTNRWVNHASQLNWSLDNILIETEWVMRLDADEVITSGLGGCLNQRLPLIPSPIAGLTINRQIHFMGKWIRHGGIYPIQVLRIWRNGQGRCENRWMDEHIVVKGALLHLDADIADINLNNMTWWVAKHNQYSIREAIELLRSEQTLDRDENKGAVMSRQARIKRWLKSSVYTHLPLGLRSGAYFGYRYVLRLGFLDGWRGLAFHFLQGLWYRFLVDVKVYEIRTWMVVRKQTLREVVQAEFGLDI